MSSAPSSTRSARTTASRTTSKTVTSPDVDVEIKNVILDDLRQSPYSARIESEKVDTRIPVQDHTELKRERWTASVTYVFRENVKNNELAVIPLGLTIVRFLELLRGTGHRLGLLTNGHQFRLVYAGLDFESWCEWESDRWFDDGEGTEELNGLRQLLSPDALEAGQGRHVRACSMRSRSPASGRPICPACCGRTSVRPSNYCSKKCRRPTALTKNLFASLVAASSDRPADRRRGSRSVAPGHGAGGDAAGGLPVCRVPATAAGQ